MQQTTKFRLTIGVAVLVCTGTAFLLWWNVTRVPEPSADSAVVDTRVARLLDGVRVAPERANARPVAVVIDGGADGLPTEGLAAAALVWEAPVEGGIPRFLAVYPSDALPKTIGPVRSLRPYFLDFAQEIGALLLHVGGSPEALRLARATPLDRLNQFYDHVYFWRERTRRAPHNVFTSQYLVSRVFAERSFAKEHVFPTWRYTAMASLLNEGEGIALQYTTPTYAIAWRWNGARGLYERTLAGERQVDGDGTPVRAANVLVQLTRVAILDSIGRRRITTDGDGKALVLSGGRQIAAQWKKVAGDRTRFYDILTNEEIALVPGVTWIEVMPNTAEITSSSEN